MRAATLDIYDQGFIEGTSDAANVPPLAERLGPVDVERLVLEAIVQSGIDRVNLVRGSADGPATSLPQFLQDRVRRIDATISGLSIIALQAAFGRSLPPAFKEETRYKPVRKILYFLAALFAAVHHRGGMICVSGLPSLDTAGDLLPPDILVPLKGLFAQMQRVDSAAASSISLDRRMVSATQQILNTRAFEAYVAAHAQLDDLSCPIPDSLEAVRQATEEFTRRNQRLLRRSRVPLGLLPLTAKVADLVSGGILGRVGDSVADLVAAALDQKRRLVVYDYSDLSGLIIRSRVSSLVEGIRREENAGPATSRDDGG